jgi:hypothetical protein
MIEENKPADAPRLRRAQGRTGHHLLGRNWRRLIMARRWSMPTNHRSETDAATGEESEYATPFLKGYAVFNVEQIDGLPEHYYAKTAPRIDTIERAESIALFELKDDVRRPSARRPDGYQEPTLFVEVTRRVRYSHLFKSEDHKKAMDAIAADMFG